MLVSAAVARLVACRPENCSLTLLSDHTIHLTVFPMKLKVISGGKIYRGYELFWAAEEINVDETR